MVFSFYEQIPHIIPRVSAPAQKHLRSEGRRVCAKMENRTFARGEGVSKKQTSMNKGGGGSKNHPIYANVIIEWSLKHSIKPNTSMAPAEPSWLISQSCLEMNCSYKSGSALFRDSHDVQEAHCFHFTQ